MKKLLDGKPDLNAFLECIGKDVGYLNMLGINPDDIKTLKDLTDLMMVIKSLGGSPLHKSYIDEQYDRETSLELMSETAS